MNTLEREVCVTLRTIMVGEVATIDMPETIIEYLWWVECDRWDQKDYELVVTPVDDGGPCEVFIRPWNEGGTLVGGYNHHWLVYVLFGAMFAGVVASLWQKFGLELSLFIASYL